MNKKAQILPWLICGLGALFYTYEYFLRILPSVMAQDLMHAFNINTAMFGNLMAFYYYAYTPMQLPVGVMMDRIGPRRLLVFAALMCAMGTYLFAHHYLAVAQTGRFFIGFGSAFAFVGVMKLASIWLPPSRFGMIAGLATTLGMLGAMGGDILLAELVRDLGPQTTLYFAAVAGVVLTVILWLAIPERNKPVTARTNSQPISFSQLVNEVLTLFRKPQTWLIGLVGFLLYLSLSVFAEAWGVAYLIRAHGVSNQIAARLVSMVFLGWAIGGPIVGWVSDQMSNRCKPIIFGALGGAVVFTTVLYLPGLNTLTIGALLFLFGVLSSVQVIIFPIAHEANPSHLAGTAIAVTNMLVMLGGVLFQPLIGYLLGWLSGHDSAELASFAATDFERSMLIIPVGFIIAGMLMLYVKETRGCLKQKE